MSTTRPNPFELTEDGAQDLSDFRPKVADTPIGSQGRALEKAAVTDLALQSGFRINNYEEKPIRAERKAPAVETCLRTLRLNTADYNRFRRWCNKNGYSAATGLKILLEYLPKGKS